MPAKSSPISKTVAEQKPIGAKPKVEIGRPAA
jgi:hypothetical protein